MTALDLSALSPEVTLLGATTVAGPRSALTSTPVTGFSDVASVTIVTRVERVDNSNGEILSVTVQGSEDGDTWATVAGPYSFAREGTQTLTVDAPADRLRVTYSAARGVREATIGSVTARLGAVNAPSAVQTATVHVTAAQILAIGDGTPKVLVAAPDANTVLVPLFIGASFRAGSVAYDNDPSLRVRWSTYGAFYFEITSGSTLAALNDVAVFQGFNQRVEFDTDSGAATSPQGEALVLTANSITPFTPPLGDGTYDLTVDYVSWSLT